MKIPLIAAAFSLLLAIQTKAAPLIDLKAADFDAWMKSGHWQSRRDSPKDWRFDPEGLSMASRGNSVLIGSELAAPVDISAFPILRMRLAILETPRGTELKRKSGDDAAFRLYLVFDRSRGLLSLPDTIAYAWTENLPAGSIVQSAHAANMKYVSIGSGVTKGSVEIAGDVEADYRRAFPKEKSVPRLKGVLLKCDSNDTRTSARARLSSVELTGRGK